MPHFFSTTYLSYAFVSHTGCPQALPCIGAIDDLDVNFQDIDLFLNQDNVKLPLFLHDLMCIYEQASSQMF
eukprot:1156727-Pelagomonas_calceolata.AAC.2